MRDSKERFLLKRLKIRKKVAGTKDRPRLSVYRGHKHIYAQLIDDDQGNTLVYASTLSQELKRKLKTTDTVSAAKAVGELIAKKAVEKGIKKVVFDRSGHLYHGRIKELAETARQAGLEF